LTDDQSAYINGDGLTLSMLLYPIRFDSVDIQTPIFSISRYLDVSLVNRSRTLRLDLYP